MHVLRLIAVSLVAALGAAAASEAAAPVPTVFYNMYYAPLVKPKQIFLTANSGPYLRKLRWRDWGSGYATGKGRFIAHCASCGERENKPVVVTMSKPVFCAATGLRAYRRITIHVVDPTRDRDLVWRSGCPPKGSAQPLED